MKHIVRVLKVTLQGIRISEQSIAVLVSILIASMAHAQALSIKVDASQRFQTIDNFAASDCWWAQEIGDEWSTANKDSIADFLFSRTKGIGLSAWRFNIGAGTDSTIPNPWQTIQTFQIAPGRYDWSRQAGQQWFLQAAKERGVNQFVAFVNSPPRSMTRNGHSYCTDGLGSTNLKPGYEGQYATYLVDILKHFRDSLGINFNYVSPVNEPEWDWSTTKQEGNRASDDDIRNIVDSLHAELNNQGVSTKIIIPESGSLPDWYNSQSTISNQYGKTYADYLDSLFGYTDISSKAAKIFAGHSYGSDLLNGQLVENREALRLKMAPYLSNGYEYWVTEYCEMVGPNHEGGNGRDLTMTTALNVARLIHFDLTKANASAWQWWTAVSRYNYKDGLIYTDFVNAGDNQNIIQSKLLWALGNFSKFIRPGSQRIDCTGADNKTGLMASAYVDSASDRAIVVLVNAATADQEINVSLSGFNSSQSIKYFTPFVTSNIKGDDIRKYPSLSVDSAYDVPAYSVVTLVGLLNGGVYTAGTPGPTILQYPASGDTLGLGDSALVWNSIRGATSYEVLIAFDSAFSNVVIDVPGINDTTLVINNYIIQPEQYPFPPNSLGTNTKYYWRVVASNDSGSGSYSQTWSFITPAQITDVRNSAETVPGAFCVSQNYPNPFNPTTNIKVGLKKPGVVSLTIYNVLGQMVAQIDPGYKLAGEYSYCVDMNRFPSGVYFYALREGGNSITNKMLLLK